MTVAHQSDADQASRHDPVYDRLHDSDDFSELRRRYRRFVLPASAGFLAWYLLFVLMSIYAPDLMGIHVFGNVNIGLIFGLLQFLSTFGLAYAYAKYSAKHLDPLADRLHAEYEKGRRP